MDNLLLLSERQGVAVMRNKSNREDSRIAAARPYRKPTLIKGPVLTNVTAAKQIVSGPLPPCWVARAAFGDADIRWMIFQAWLIDDAPLWFRRLYIRHGESIGAWLAGRANARRAVRRLMMPTVERKLRN